MNSHSIPPLPILLVDDETDFLDSASLTLQTAGYNHIVTLQDSSRVMPYLEANGAEVVFLDLIMPNLSGEDLLAKIVQEFPEIPVIVITGLNDVEPAVRCLRAGAIDYLVKPVEPSRYVAAVRQALEIRQLKREVHSLRDSLLSRTLRYPDAFREIITKNEVMHAMFQYVEMVAPTSRPLMITGETGVGKELIARVVHELSRRKGKFVSVNAAGLEDTLFSDTLFGHVKGAFTGAEHKRSGLIEQAGGGTLFLDEIGDMEMATQIKILRLLQEGEYYQLGSDIPRQTDARILVATNHDLHQLQHEDRFRKDLYYRLSTHHVHVPPLRERKDDLPLLIDYFLGEAAAAMGKKKPTAPECLVPLFSTYDFPGNVRELQSMIFDAVTRHTGGILSTQSIRDAVLEHRGGHVFSGEEVYPGRDDWEGSFDWHAVKTLPSLKEAEQTLIEEAMKRAGENQSIAAELLGISRLALHRRFKKYHS